MLDLLCGMKALEDRLGEEPDPAPDSGTLTLLLRLTGFGVGGRLGLLQGD